MATHLVRETDDKGFCLARFWVAGTNYQITDRTGTYVLLTEDQARLLVEILKADLAEPHP